MCTKKFKKLFDRANLLLSFSTVNSICIDFQFIFCVVPNRSFLVFTLNGKHIYAHFSWLNLLCLYNFGARFKSRVFCYTQRSLSFSTFLTVTARRSLQTKFCRSKTKIRVPLFCWNICHSIANIHDAYFNFYVW